ncbi:hypothetical protein BDZ89DRAFT_305120 [Hymenopellis radicata]|nr:hypothetical protein BDZ89DRAFT_305120 [Hymenopellis radicata]
MMSTVDVPDDICREIFLNTVPCWDDLCDESIHLDSLDGSHSPWTVSHVSRRWRALSLTFPRLWSCIAVYLPCRRGASDHAQRLAQRLAMHIARARSADLFIRIYAFRTPYPLHPVFPVLFPSMSRWSHLCLAVPHDLYVQIGLHIHQLGMLRALCIVDPLLGRVYGDGRPAGAGVLAMFRCLPQLEELVCDARYFEQGRAVGMKPAQVHVKLLQPFVKDEQ